jgi:anaerobic dimethyl sulfoxide reductase subunit C (anchor subunit)
MLAALGHPTSGIFTEAVLVGITAIFAIVYLVMLKREASDAGRKVVICIAAAVGIVLSFMAGASYMMAARASWNTFLLPLGYMATAIPAGVAAYLTVAAARKQKIEAPLPTILLAGGIIAAVCAALYAFASGQLANSILYIWVMAVLVGGLLPAVLGYMLQKKPESALSFAAVALLGALIGSVAFRCFMWLAATNVDNFFQTL